MGENITTRKEINESMEEALPAVAQEEKVVVASKVKTEAEKKNKDHKKIENEFVDCPSFR